MEIGKAFQWNSLSRFAHSVNEETAAENRILANGKEVYSINCNSQPEKTPSRSSEQRQTGKPISVFSCRNNPGPFGGLVFQLPLQTSILCLICMADILNGH